MVAKKTAEETAAEHDGAHESPAEQAPATAKGTAKKAAMRQDDGQEGGGEEGRRQEDSHAEGGGRREARRQEEHRQEERGQEGVEKGRSGGHGGGPGRRADGSPHGGSQEERESSRSRRTGHGPRAHAARAAAPDELAVRPGEDPWTPEEVTEARTLLTSETLRLRSELEASGAALAGLMRDSGDGAGDDEADTGTKNITREHELSLAANAQEMLEQTERALARLEAGTYGLCEVCGKPIGKARMQAFPRATLCVEDKQKQERRG